MFSGRSVENEVRWWHVAGSTDGLKRGTCFLVEVEIGVAYLADLFFRPASRSFPDRIHANEDVGTRLILLVKPRLKGSTRNCLGSENPLRRLLATAIPDKNGYLVA